MKTGQVRYAREQLTKGVSQYKIAKELGVSQTTINFISGCPNWGEIRNTGRRVVRMHDLEEDAYRKIARKQLRAMREYIGKTERAK